MRNPHPKKVMRFSNFWRESKVALKSQLYHKFWELETWQKAWLIAAIETDELLAQVIDMFGQEDDDAN